MSNYSDLLGVTLALGMTRLGFWCLATTLPPLPDKAAPWLPRLVTLPKLSCQVFPWPRLPLLMWLEGRCWWGCWGADLLPRLCLLLPDMADLTVPPGSIIRP